MGSGIYYLLEEGGRAKMCETPSGFFLWSRMGGWVDMGCVYRVVV